MLAGLFATKKLKDLFYYISLISLIVFCGLRFETGNDYYSYSEIYESFGTSAEIQSFEIMFNISMYVAKVLGFSFITFLLVFTALIISIFFTQLKSLYKNYSIPILLFVLNDMPILVMSLVRQGMAVAIVFVATYFLWEKKYFKFLALACLAIMFHLAAIYLIMLILAAYAISLFKIESTRLILLLFLTIYLITFQLVPADIFPLVNLKLQIYQNGFNEDDINFFLSNYFLFKVSIILIYLFYFYKKNLVSYENLHFLILLFSIVFNILFYNYGEINLRMNYFFDMSLILLSSYLILNTTKKIRPYISIYIFTYFTFHYFRFIYGMSENFIPYKSFLFHG
jgi:hypothetical protein